MSAVPTSRSFLGIVPWYSFLILVGAVLALCLAILGEKRTGLPKDTMIDLALRILPIGILGARIYYVIFSWDLFRDHPLSALFVWNGGLAIYGGVIAGVITVLFFCRKRRLSAAMIFDLLSPGLALAQAIGRWGNYFNMEAYGIPVSRKILCCFPLSVQIPSENGFQWHLACFFYESCWCFCIFIFLIVFSQRLFREKGDLFLFYVFLYSAERLVLEETRMDSLQFDDIRFSQLVSLLACCCCLLFLGHRTVHAHPSRQKKICAATGSSLLLSVPVLGYMLRMFGKDAAPIVVLPSLFCYSVIMILLLFLIYGKTVPQEAVYANHKV